MKQSLLLVVLALLPMACATRGTSQPELPPEDPTPVVQDQFVAYARTLRELDAAGRERRPTFLRGLALYRLERRDPPAVPEDTRARVSELSPWLAERLWGAEVEPQNAVGELIRSRSLPGRLGSLEPAELNDADSAMAEHFLRVARQQDLSWVPIPSGVDAERFATRHVRREILMDAARYWGRVLRRRPDTPGARDAMAEVLREAAEISHEWAMDRTLGDAFRSRQMTHWESLDHAASDLADGRAAPDLSWAGAGMLLDLDAEGLAAGGRGLVLEGIQALAEKRGTRARRAFEDALTYLTAAGALMSTRGESFPLETREFLRSALANLQRLAQGGG